MNILVTGGAGFIGGHLAGSFVDAGHDVTTLDIMEPFYDLGLKEHNIDVARQRAAETDGSYEFIEGSTTDNDLVDDIVEANHSLLTDDSADGEAMNIDSMDNIDIATLAEVVRNDINPSLEIKYTEAREGVGNFIDWYEQNATGTSHWSSAPNARS